MNTKFYTYIQNNTGGNFIIDHKRGIDKAVIIEAKTANQANNRAKEIGLYFDGCDEGIDCPCCGDRWDRIDKDDGYNNPEIYGKQLVDVPQHQIETLPPPAKWCTDRAYVHMLDREPFNQQAKCGVVKLMVQPKVIYPTG